MIFYKLLWFLFGLPKTIYFNFKYFKFKDAIKFPFLISSKVWLAETKGKITINAPIKFGMVKIGFGSVGTKDIIHSQCIWRDCKGEIVINGNASLGYGTKITHYGGALIIGNNFVVTGHSEIICSKKVEFGDDCLLSWEVLIMDTDFHKIKNADGTINNHSKPIKIGNHVWIGCRCTILKGTEIGTDSVVASNSCVHSKINLNNALIGGNPIRVIRENISWEV
ncbi:acyltransferase [Clostridium thermarum]|uniref:acyltransferase n=1 Tax=Clostridium thermarum TaxID=1716543 RepID=UPI00111D899F|nr:acyltransferase [Clostridium thermarum]